MPLTRLLPIRSLAAIGLVLLCDCPPAQTIKVSFIGNPSGRGSALAIGMLPS